MSKQKVLIPLDGSTFSNQILKLVRDYFRPDDVELILLHIAKPTMLANESAYQVDLMTEQSYLSAHGTYTPHLEHYWSNSAQEMETYRKELQLTLAEEAKRLRQLGYQVETEVHFGDPAQRIISFVRDMDVTMVAMTSHGRTGIGRLVLGSVAERVLRSVHIPVLIWRQPTTDKSVTSAAETLAAKLTAQHELQIVTATDGSPLSRKAVTTAQWLAQKLNGVLSILVTANERTDVTHSQELTQDIAQLVLDTNTQSQVIPLVGYTDEVVLNYLGNNAADLLVIGAFEDRGTGATTTGATAQRLLQYAPTSVLIHRGAVEKFQRILVAAALDDETVVKVATEVATKLNAQLDLLHVLPAKAASYLSKSEYQEVQLSSVLEQNTHLSSVLRHWILQLNSEGYSEENLHLYQGEALQTILKFLRADHYDLVIVGSQSGAGHFLGSVANGVVQFADESALVVRTKEA